MHGPSPTMTVSPCLTSPMSREIDVHPVRYLYGRCRAYCPHADKKRFIRGTWLTLEVQKTIQMGYEVKDIEVVWHWEKRSVFDPVTKTGGLFTDYINQFLQLKQEASCYPDWCMTPEDKQRYVEDYFKNEGIRLNPNNIRKNPGLRSLAKLCLNSMWGKFPQRSGLRLKSTMIPPKCTKCYKATWSRWIIFASSMRRSSRSPIRKTGHSLKSIPTQTSLWRPLRPVTRD